MRDFREAALALTMVPLFAVAGHAASQEHMMEICRSYAAEHLGRDENTLTVEYVGVLKDQAPAVKGVAAGDPPIHFLCTLFDEGRRVLHLTVRSPEDECPPGIDASESYLYPECN